MSDWKPGTVAKATVRGVPDVTVFRRDVSEGFCDWAHDSVAVGYTCSHDPDVTNVRPLVVLDIDNLRACEAEAASPALAAKRLRATNSVVAHAIADQIEAQTKPPKPAEPTGLGAVVEDDLGRRWVRIDDDPELNKPWRPADMAAIRSHWQNVKAVRVLSEGVA